MSLPTTSFRATILASVALTAAFLFYIPPQPASADPPSCYGASCTDLDPSETDCVNDAVTIWSVDAATYGHLEMRYSARCHANWTRFTEWKPFGTNFFDSSRWVQGEPWIWREGSSDAPRGLTNIATDGRGSSFWTSMVSAEGRTCMSVDMTDRVVSASGGAESSDLGNYTAGCIG